MVTEEEIARALWASDNPPEHEYSLAAPREWGQWPDTPRHASLAGAHHSREDYRRLARAVLALVQPAPVNPAMVTKEEIASIVRQAMHSNPEEGPFRHRESERSLIAADAARRILALFAQPPRTESK